MWLEITLVVLCEQCCDQRNKLDWRVSGSKPNSVKTNSRRMRPVGNILCRRDGTFKGSEGETKCDMFKVVKGYLGVLNFHEKLSFTYQMCV